MSGLRDLDDRLVPRAAARLRAAVDRAGRRRAALTGAVRAALVPLADGSALRRLDDRFARRGPLAVVRRAPQVGVVVALAVLLAGAGVALARGDDATPTTGAEVAPTARTLGPEVGDDVAGYVEDSRERAVARAREEPDAQQSALVSLVAYATPQQAADLLVGVEVQRAYLRVPADDPSEVLVTDVRDLEADLAPLYAATALRKAEDQREFGRLAQALAADGAQREFREFYELSARIAGREAEAYRTGCACVFAVVVRGPAAALAELPALQGVRAVELAPEGVALPELRVRPLDPATTTTVEAGAAPRPGAR